MIKVSEERRRSGTSSSSTEDSIVIRADPALDRWDIMHHHISLLLCGRMGPKDGMVVSDDVNVATLDITILMPG